MESLQDQLRQLQLNLFLERARRLDQRILDRSLPVAKQVLDDLEFVRVYCRRGNGWPVSVLERKLDEAEAAVNRAAARQTGDIK